MSVLEFISNYRTETFDIIFRYISYCGEITVLLPVLPLKRLPATPFQAVMSREVPLSFYPLQSGVKIAFFLLYAVLSPDLYYFQDYT